MNKTMKLILAGIAVFVWLINGCDLFGEDEEEKGPGKITFQITGEDITYDNLTGEDGYNHVKNATIEYAYMIVKTPKLNPKGHAKQGALAKIAHTGVSLSGMFAVDLMKKTVLGTLENVEAGSYAEAPSINLYNPTSSERADITDENGVLDKIPQGFSFRFGGMIHEKEGGASHRYEIRENITAKIKIEEFPPEAGAGAPLEVKSGETLVAEFHPHIDHALEIICHDNKLDFAALDTSGDTIVFSPAKNKTYYSDIEAHISRGDHWDVNIIPD
jgi:hypothetical protein